MNFNYNFTEIYSQGPFNNIPALLQIMSWWWPGDKPLSESMMVSLLTHICIIQPQWIKIKAWIINYIHSFVWDIYNSLAKLPLTLTHWGRVTHICVDKLTIIGSDSGLSPGRRQAIIWTNAGILLIRHLGTNISEIQSGNHTFSFKKMHLKMSSAKWRPFCLGLNMLRHECVMIMTYHCLCGCNYLFMS